MDTTLLHTDVLVIGAGPTGLMAGAWLQKFGIDAKVVDLKSGPTKESRALALQARSMEIYRQLGLADEVQARAVPTGEMRPGIGARSFKSIKLNRLGYSQTHYAGLTMLEQSANEELLAEHLKDGGQRGAVEARLRVLRGHRGPDAHQVHRTRGAGALSPRAT